MPNLGAMEIILIILIILLLFGAKKLPDLARSVGRSARIFKSEVKEMREEDQDQPQGQLPQGPNQNVDFWDRPENQPGQQPQQPYQHPNQQN